MAKLEIGKNDLQTYCIENNLEYLLNEWHSTKNGDLKPTDVTAGSGKKVWWKCLRNHEWEMCISNRTSQKQGCPYCSGQRVIEGETDLQTLYPEIAKEWHPTKNIGLKNGHNLIVDTPNKILPYSNIKVWWQCNEGHEWLQSVNSRVSKKCGCSYCSGKKVLCGFNDLLTVDPNLAMQWHPTKNGKLKASDVTIKSVEKVWWYGECGHEWQQSVYDRSKGRSCPYCSGHKAIKGKTDLQTLYPEIAKEWHPTKNGNLKPTDTTAYSSKKIWWKCSRNHEWEMCISNRTSQKQGCPYCSNKKILTGFNDLETWCKENERKDLIEEWDYEKNAELISQISPHNGKKVWWKCKYNHV